MASPFSHANASFRPNPSLIPRAADGLAAHLDRRAHFTQLATGSLGFYAPPTLWPRAGQPPATPHTPGAAEIAERSRFRLT